MSKHYGEDELILYYYGEGHRRGAIDEHLRVCDACRAVYRELAATLGLVVAPEPPERGEQYGAEVWQRIRHRLPERDTGWMTVFGRDWLAVAGAAAVLLLVVAASFTAGRLWTDGPATDAAQATHDADTRARTVAIADHLERSERVLMDVVNAEGSRVDLSDAKAWASDLVEANRLYRAAAVRGGDGLVADVLDDLERNLLEIVHGPSTPTLAELNQLRVRIDAVALLFRVRVLQEELREREIAPAFAKASRQTT